VTVVELGGIEIVVGPPGAAPLDDGDCVETFGFPKGEVLPVLDRDDCAAFAVESVSPVARHKAVRAVADVVNARDMIVLLK
jgi:hypothetical protein